MMSRREAIAGLACAALTVPCQASAQQAAGKMARIGVLSAADSETTPIFDAFRRGLRDLGYVEGRNVKLEFRLSRGDYDRLSALADELVALPVDIIVAEGGTPARAAADATRTIPIVMHTVADPIALGLADTLARPGRNVTGFSLMGPEVSAKLIDLMRSAFPDANAVTILVNPTNQGSEAMFQIAEAAARSVGLSIVRVEAASPESLRALAPDELSRGGPVFVIPNAMFWNHRKVILSHVAAARVSALYYEREYAEEGGLMAYGPSIPEAFRQAASYVDRILKGAKPADLPIQEPVKLELIVNLKAADSLGITLPPAILARADKVIE